MPELIIHDIPEAIIEAIKRNADLNQRSLDEELVAVLETAAGEFLQQSPALIAARIRARLSEGGRTFDDSAMYIREDRDR